MKNDGQRLQNGGGGPRSAARSNGFFSLRTISSYLRIVSSGASTVASTVRSAGASVASSIVDREDEGRDQVNFVISLSISLYLLFNWMSFGVFFGYDALIRLCVVERWDFGLNFDLGVIGELFN